MSGMEVWVEVNENENLAKRVVFEHPDCLPQAVVEAEVGKAEKSCCSAVLASG